MCVCERVRVGLGEGKGEGIAGVFSEDRLITVQEGGAWEGFEFLGGCRKQHKAFAYCIQYFLL